MPGHIQYPPQYRSHPLGSRGSVYPSRGMPNAWSRGCGRERSNPARTAGTSHSLLPKQPGTLGRNFTCRPPSPLPPRARSNLVGTTRTSRRHSILIFSRIQSQQARGARAPDGGGTHPAAHVVSHFSRSVQLSLRARAKQPGTLGRNFAPVAPSAPFPAFLKQPGRHDQNFTFPISLRVSPALYSHSKLAAQAHRRGRDASRTPRYVHIHAH